jgi:thioredoxin reductase (NADPH)
MVEWPMMVGIAAFLTGVFALLGLWSRTIQRAQDKQLGQVLIQAKEQGLNQALTQYPHIDRDRCLGCGSCVRACPERGVLALVAGRSCLVYPAHCVGHGCCEEVCPVGAITVGLGDTSARPDIPILSNDLETSVTNVFIAGELGGIGLIRHTINQGTRVVEVIADRLKSKHMTFEGKRPLDVLIIGCGPAGIAATLKAHELGLSYAVLDQGDIGGAVRKYPRSKLTLTQPVDLPLYGRMNRTQYTKEELIELWEGVFRETGIEVLSHARFIDLEHTEAGTLLVTTSVGAFDCHSLVLALGRRGTPRRLGVPGEEAEHVLYQLSDAADYTHLDILVVGGGDSAIEAAVALASQPGNRVTLSYRRQGFFRIKQRNRTNIEQFQQEGRITILYQSVAKHIKQREVLLAINTENGEESQEKVVAADYLFILAGGEPPYPLLKKIGIRFGELPESEVDLSGQTQGDS